MAMTVTFKKLHKVIYDRRETHTVLAQYQRSYLDYKVNLWLEDNCQGKYYHSPGWHKEKFIEFDNDSDATMFALRWGR